jgi:tetratricopeptide (TPR) repeat protein
MWLMSANRGRHAIEVLTTQLQPEKGAMRGWPAYWVVRADAHHLLGEHDRELDVARQAREVYPDRLQIVQAELLALSALGRTEEAMNLLDQSANMEPDWVGSPGAVMVRTGHAFSAHGYEAQAQRVFERAIEWSEDRSPEEASTQSVRSLLAYALYEAGRLDESRALYEELARDFAANPFYGACLGIVAAKRGDRAEAIRTSEWVAGLDSPRVRTRSFWRAIIAAHLGEREQAVQLLRVYFNEVGFDPIYLHTSAFASLRDYPPFEELMRPKD